MDLDSFIEEVGLECQTGLKENGNSKHKIVLAADYLVLTYPQVYLLVSRIAPNTEEALSNTEGLTKCAEQYFSTLHILSN